MTRKTPNKKEFETLSEFRYRLRRFLRFSEQVTRKNGITPLQYLLLLHIKGFPGRNWATVGELAERLQAQHHGTVALISRCEKLGWVARRQGQADRRAVEVHLTESGERMAAKMAQLHRDEHLDPGGSLLLPQLQHLQHSQEE
ncbi:MAG: winged helix-turn-helix transcriptional regulator [Betaproteobacteria bacterium]|nr:winged helix-turn-helix transcriptional regulator [Betaproteobacteria bacterium]